MATKTVAEYSSIQSAVDAAHPGDTIHIAPGIYRETVVIDKPNITIIGDGAIISGADTWTGDKWRFSDGVYVSDMPDEVLKAVTLPQYVLDKKPPPLMRERAMLFVSGLSYAQVANRDALKPRTFCIDNGAMVVNSGSIDMTTAPVELPLRYNGVVVTTNAPGVHLRGVSVMHHANSMDQNELPGAIQLRGYQPTLDDVTASANSAIGIHGWSWQGAGAADARLNHIHAMHNGVTGVHLNRLSDVWLQHLTTTSNLWRAADWMHWYGAGVKFSRCTGTYKGGRHNGENGHAVWLDYCDSMTVDGIMAAGCDGNGIYVEVSDKPITLVDCTSESNGKKNAFNPGGIAGLGAANVALTCCSSLNNVGYQVRIDDDDRAGWQPTGWQLDRCALEGDSLVHKPEGIAVKHRRTRFTRESGDEWESV